MAQSRTIYKICPPHGQSYNLFNRLIDCEFLVYVGLLKVNMRPSTASFNNIIEPRLYQKTQSVKKLYNSLESMNFESVLRFTLLIGRIPSFLKNAYQKPMSL